MKKFSIVIPAYNNLELFKSALTSVLIQNFENYEIIVVDDSQNDQICDYLNKLCLSRIRYYHNHPSKGAVQNWNYGLSLSEGDAIIVLHHDESFINSDYLFKLNTILDNYDIVIANKKIVTEYGEKKERFPNWYKKLTLLLAFPIFSLNVVGPCACICFKRELMIPFDQRMHWMVDVDWYYRLLNKSRRRKYISSKEILSRHGHCDQISVNIMIDKAKSEDVKILKEKYNNNVIIAMMLKLAKLFRLIRNILYK